MTTENHLVLEQEISAPPHVVFEFFTDPALLIEWLGIAAELDPQPEGIFQFEVAPGEHCRGRSRMDGGRYFAEIDGRRAGWRGGSVFMGKEIVSSFRVEAYDSGRMVEIRSTGGSFPLHIVRRVDPSMPTAPGYRPT